jgi:hypothetical protein
MDVQIEGNGCLLMPFRLVRVFVQVSVDSQGAEIRFKEPESLPQ